MLFEGVLLGRLLFCLTVPSVIYFYEFDTREWSLFINREGSGYEDLCVGMGS